MKNYEREDNVTFYFVLSKRASGGNDIKAWSDDKCCVEFYVKFHNCPNHHIRKVSKKMRDISSILNENHNDEIEIMNIITRDKNNRPKIIQIPMTTTERSVVDDASKTFCSAMVDYSALNDHVGILKPKYQKSLERIGMMDIIRSTIYNKSTKFISEIEIDQLRLLARLFKGDFN
jgi:hypothetical protein